MCAMQNFTQPQQQNQQQIQQPPIQPPQPVYKFRWGVFLGIPLTIALFIYIIKNIDPSFEFRDFLNRWEIVEHMKFTRLACLAVLCIAFLLIVKLFRNNRP